MPPDHLVRDLLLGGAAVAVVTFGLEADCTDPMCQSVREELMTSTEHTGGTVLFTAPVSTTEWISSSALPDL